MSVPPPIITHNWGGDQGSPREKIVRFEAGPIQCDGALVTPQRLERPFPATTISYGPDNPTRATYTMTFQIGGDGRPAGIRLRAVPPYSVYGNSREDLTPALAASRFAAGAPRRNCTMTYIENAILLEHAPLPLVYETASMSLPGPAARQLFDRARPLGSNCKNGPGQVHRLNYPAFETIKQEAATRSWVFLAFDVDRKGRTNNVRLLGSSGREALDRQGVKAVGQNRYAPGGGYSGCVFYFYHNGPQLPIPALPPGVPEETSETAACILEPKGGSSVASATVFPAEFLQRKIPGIAVIGYDTAPWGDIGNIKVLAAEPAEAFGIAASNGLASQRVRQSETGHRGCVARFVFKLPDS